MGAKRRDDLGGDFPPVSEEDFVALDAAGPTTAPAAGIDDTDIERSGFVPATAENLNHLAPGCFVLMLTDDVYCWAEVVSIDGERIGGRLHNELSTSTCLIRHHTAETVFFHRDQIKALGCERYCWC